MLALPIPGCVYFSSRTPSGVCAVDVGVPIRNFCVVTPGVLWEGERPTLSDSRWLLEQHVGSIVSLELDDRATLQATTLASDLTRSALYFRVTGLFPLQMLNRAHVDDRIALVLAIVRTAPKPVYVHCRAGVDRTVLVAAIYRVLFDGADPEQVVAQFRHFRSPWFLLEAAYIRSFTPPRRLALLRKVRDWELQVRPNGSIRCGRGHCRYLAS